MMGLTRIKNDFSTQLKLVSHHGQQTVAHVLTHGKQQHGAGYQHDKGIKFPGAGNLAFFVSVFETLTGGFFGFFLI